MVTEGVLRTGEQIRVPTVIEPGLRVAEFRVTWPGSNIDLRLTDPNKPTPKLWVALFQFSVVIAERCIVLHPHSRVSTDC